MSLASDWSKTLLDFAKCVETCVECDVEAYKVWAIGLESSGAMFANAKTISPLLVTGSDRGRDSVGSFIQKWWGRLYFSGTTPRKLFDR